MFLFAGTSDVPLLIVTKNKCNANKLEIVYQVINKDNQCIQPLIEDRQVKQYDNNI